MCMCGDSECPSCGRLQGTYSGKGKTMDTLTAVRTFAKPGFCPVKRTRLFNDRWYKVTFQNVEHGQGDYIGLAAGVEWAKGSIEDCDRILAIGLSNFDSTVKQIR
jgi:hypothetical protein